MDSKVAGVYQHVRWLACYSTELGQKRIYKAAIGAADGRYPCADDGAKTQPNHSDTAN